MIKVFSNYTFGHKLIVLTTKQFTLDMQKHAKQKSQKMPTAAKKFFTSLKI